MDAEKLIFLEESGLHMGMTRSYGRAISHERVNDIVPFNKGKRITLIAAIGVNGVKTALYGDWYMDGIIFIDFLKKCLLPVLEPGQVVIMDNLAAHKVEFVRELIESAGAKLIYLPPYSPDLNPIELFWSKIKAYIRSKEARTLAALNEAIKNAFKFITAMDLEGWFEHCGYSIQ
jgi:transposase